MKSLALWIGNVVDTKFFQPELLGSILMLAFVAFLRFRLKIEVESLRLSKVVLEFIFAECFIRKESGVIFLFELPAPPFLLLDFLGNLGRLILRN